MSSTLCGYGPCTGSTPWPCLFCLPVAGAFTTLLLFWGFQSRPESPLVAGWVVHCDGIFRPCRCWASTACRPPGLNLITGRLLRKFWPLSPRALVADVLSALKGKLAHTTQPPCNTGTGLNQATLTLLFKPLTFSI